MEECPQENGLIFRQLFEKSSSTYTYLLGCANTKEAVLIDPVLEMVERDLNLVKQLDLKLLYGINTHVHADHITGTGKIKESISDCKSVLGDKSGGKANKFVGDGEILKFGDLELECRSTPGHTNGCTTYVLHSHKKAFTGDTLLIRGCGRTDFQEGSPSNLFDSVHSKIFSLPPSYQLYPAHDYKGFNVTSVAEESTFNPRLTLEKDKFIELMNNLNLSYPKHIDRAVPANLECGVF